MIHNGIHLTVIRKLEDENIYHNIVDTLTDRIFCGGGNPAHLQIAIRDEIAGRWGISMWDEGIPEVLKLKIENMAVDMEVKYQQLVTNRRQTESMVGEEEIKFHQPKTEVNQNSAPEMITSTQRSSQMEPLFGTIEVSDESDSEEGESDSFEDTAAVDCNTPISFSQGLPRPVLDCMKSPEVNPITTDESPENETRFVPKGTPRVMDEETSKKFPPRVVAMMHSILPMTPSSGVNMGKNATPLLAKKDSSLLTPATSARKPGPACKTTYKAVVEQKTAPPLKKTEMVEDVDNDGFVTVGKGGKKAKIPSPVDKQSNK